MIVCISFNKVYGLVSEAWGGDIIAEIEERDWLSGDGWFYAVIRNGPGKGRVVRVNRNEISMPPCMMQRKS